MNIINRNITIDLLQLVNEASKRASLQQKGLARDIK